MWHGLSVMWLALAVSMDGFGAGTTYGMRKVRIPFGSILIIAGCSGMVIYLAMLMGQGISHFLPPVLTHGIGAVLFIAIGLFALSQAGGAPKKVETKAAAQPPAKPAEPTIWTFQLEKWGLVVQILKTPMVADMDESGTISGYEAVLLGTALSLDAFAAGVGAAFIGMPPLAAALAIGLMSAVCLRAGMWFGFKYAERARFRWMGYAPGVFLIILGLLRLI
ncbi:hypothetical protein ADL26_12000 [Thermoactinomyces vulgaris]|jgi:putative sporulation protein YtaF|nr:hypothetical protein ADL26_12000 [Thermoactinomyces vulgaris]